MALAAKLLRQLPRAHAFTSSSSSTYSFSNAGRFFYMKFEPLKSSPNTFLSLLRKRVSNFRYTFSGADGKYLWKSSFFIGRRLSKETILGASVVLGSMCLWPNVSFALDERFMDDSLEDFGDLIGEREEKLWKFATKFWLPILFCLTMLTNMSHPLTLVSTKAILFLLSTKPNPLSVYIFMKKCDYGSKMEVGDYKVLCVAKVETEEQELTVVGILGGWWALPTLAQVADEFNAVTSLALNYGIMYIYG